MPVIKSAIKKLRQDKKRAKLNDLLRSDLKETVRKAKKDKSGNAVANAMAVIDKAAKKNILHENKAARMKSSLSKLAKPVKSKTSPTKAKVSKSSKPATKKAPKK